MDIVSVVSVTELGGYEVARYPIKAESAIMSPSKDRKLMALMSDRVLEVFDIQSKQRIKRQQMATDLVFWKWILPNILALVTKSPNKVYHWSIDDVETKPVAVMPRQSAVQCTVQDYQVSVDKRWSVLFSKSHSDGMIICEGWSFLANRPFALHVLAACLGNIPGTGGANRNILTAIVHSAGPGTDLVLQAVDLDASLEKSAPTGFLNWQRLYRIPLNLPAGIFQMTHIEKKNLVAIAESSGWVHFYSDDSGQVCCKENTLKAAHTVSVLQCGLKEDLILYFEDGSLALLNSHLF